MASITFLKHESQQMITTSTELQTSPKTKELSFQTETASTTFPPLEKMKTTSARPTEKRRSRKRNRSQRKHTQHHMLPDYLRHLHSPENPEKWTRPSHIQDLLFQCLSQETRRVNWSITVLLAHYRTKRPFFYKMTSPEDTTARVFISNGSFGSVFSNRMMDNTVLAVKSMKLEPTQHRNQHILRDIMCLKILHKSDFVVPLICLTWTKSTSLDSHVTVELWMPYAKGDLYTWSTRDNPDVQQIENVCGQLAVGLEHIHACGIMHRDIGLSNVLVFACPGTKYVRVQYCDFGCATLTWTTKYSRLLTLHVCKAPYRAPEIVKGVPFYNEMVDIWSLGCVFHELLYESMLFDVAQARKTRLVCYSMEGDAMKTSNRYLLDLHWDFISYVRGGRSAIVENAIDQMLCIDPSRRICAAHVSDLLHNHKF